MNLDFNSIWKYKFVLLIFSLAGLGGGFAYLWLVPTTFEAQARVLIEPRMVSPDADPLGRVVPEFMPTQAETIRSPLTIREAIKTLEIAIPPGADPAKFDPVEHVLSSLNVTPLLNANVVTVSYRSIDESQATELIEKVISAYEEFVNSSDRGSSGTKVQLIAAGEEKLRQELRKLENDYEELRKLSPVIGQGRVANQDAIDEIELANRELILVKTEKKEYVTRLLGILDIEQWLPSSDVDPELLTRISIKSVLSDELPSRGDETRLVLKKPSLDNDGVDPISDDVEYFAESKKILQVVQYSDTVAAQDIFRLEQEYRFVLLRVSQLDGTLSENHPQLVAARATSEEYRDLIRERFQSTIKSWQRQLRSLLEKEAELEKEVSNIRSRTKAAEVYLVKEDHLNRNIENVRQLHSSTLQQLIALQGEESAISKGRNSIEIQVIDEPKVIDDMTWPKPKLLLPASLVVGLMLGVAVVGLLTMNNAQSARQSSSSASASANPEANDNELD